MDNYFDIPTVDATDSPIFQAMQEAQQEPMPVAPPVPAPAMAPTPQTPQGIFGALNNPNNAQLLLAMAGGMGSGRTPLQGLGNAFTAANEHLQYQDKLKMLQDQRKDALQLKKDQLAETQKLNAAKITELGSRADKEGTPKVLNKLGGYTTLYWPKTGQVSTHTDEEVQHLFENEQQRKLMSAALMGGMKADNAPLPSPVIKDINESTDAIQGANNIVNVLDKTEQRLTDGSLDLGLFSNLYNQGKNLIGKSDDESRAFASLKSDLEGLRNNYLAIQKGTQTEGDAQRAWNQLISSLNDKEVVKQRIAELRELNKRAIAEHQQRINAARTDNGKEAFQFDPKSNLPAPVNPQSAVDKNIAAVQRVLGKGQSQPQQQYPKGFNPPSDGTSPASDRIRIIEQELKDEEAKDPYPGKHENVAALRRTLESLGYKPKTVTTTVTAPTQKRPLSAFGSN